MYPKMKLKPKAEEIGHKQYINEEACSLRAAGTVWNDQNESPEGGGEIFRGCLLHRLSQ